MDKSLIAEKVSWSEQAAIDFSRRGVAIDQHAVEGPDYYREAVESGELMLFRYRTENRHVGHVAVRSEDNKGGRELVIVAGSGALKGVDLIKLVVPLLARFGAINGAKSVRIHTSRKGLIAKLAKLGFAKAETIMRFQIDQ